MDLSETKQMTLPMPESLEIMPREYLRTHRWLKFQLDLRHAPVSFWLVLGECQSKCEHISGVPLRPDIASIVHQVYLAKGTWGTVAIEGNTLSEAEALQHVQGKLKVTPEKEYLKQELDNVLQEFNRMLAKVAAREPLTLSVDRLCEINAAVLKGLSIEHGVAGQIRRHNVEVMRYRGAPWADCHFLLQKLCEWLNGPDFEAKHGLNPIHMAILKAVIAHLYFEWIHPFPDGNGRSGRLIEAQILLAAGVPSPACQLLSNHYNSTRKSYLDQLKAASESGGDAVPFMTYAIDGFLTGLKSQLFYIRRLQMETTWINFIHEHFRSQPGKTSDRHKALLLDLLAHDRPVEISGITSISAAVATGYKGLNARTVLRDIEALENRKFLVREGKAVRVNLDLISGFLHIKAAV